MLFDRALSQPVLSGSSCRPFMPGGCAGSSSREFMPGVHAGSLCREFVLGVRAGSSCREFVPGVIQGLPGAPFLCYDFVLFVLFVAGVPVLYPGGDSVRTGLPVLVLGHTGDCGQLLLILLC